MKNRQDADIMLHATKAEIFQMFETLLSEVDNGVLFDELMKYFQSKFQEVFKNGIR